MIIWSATLRASAGPWSCAITASIMSAAAAPPAQVIRSPSISNTRPVTAMSGKSSAKAARFSQWMVQRRPSSSPARASTCAPVHTAPRCAPMRACRRSQPSTAGVAA